MTTAIVTIDCAALPPRRQQSLVWSMYQASIAGVRVVACVYNRTLEPLSVTKQLREFVGKSSVVIAPARTQSDSDAFSVACDYVRRNISPDEVVWRVMPWCAVSAGALCTGVQSEEYAVTYSRIAGESPSETDPRQWPHFTLTIHGPVIPAIGIRLRDIDRVDDDLVSWLTRMSANSRCMFAVQPRQLGWTFS